LSGLVSVQDESIPPGHLAEEIALRELRLLYRTDAYELGPIDYVFFRRFADGRSSRVEAYVIDNSRKKFSEREIAELHRKVWLNGSAPLLYVDWGSRVDILRCAVGPEFWNNTLGECEYKAAESIETASKVSTKLSAKKLNRFSAFRLASGTFWENPENADWANSEVSAHKTLIQTAIEVDRDIQKKVDEGLRPVMRQLLLLFVFSKYLEDRDVFPTGWFEKRSPGAICFKDVLSSNSPATVKKMLDELRHKFNGDVFDVPDFADKLDANSLSSFVELLDKRTVQRQLYLWDQYSFRYIPVEVLSHLYQHFAQEGTGAVYTPPFVADLILDQVMPYESITGNETILDPTCGSGIFLVGAFRRLVHYWQSQNNWECPSVPILKKILKHSLFGVEKLESAAHVASLNLALAVCEVLQPNVIWGNLKFDKLIDRNLFVGDFFENLDKLRSGNAGGFSTIVGNPPFASELTKAAMSTREKELRSIPIPDNQIAFRIMEETFSLLADKGMLCLIQPSGLLYSVNTESFRKQLFDSCTIDKVLDFTSIRALFDAADTKVIALLAMGRLSDETHSVEHLTFRRTKSVHERIGFEIDHYDYHDVSQTVAVRCPWVWKANLLGGGRLVNLMSKIMEWPTLVDFVREMGWSHGEGFTVGNKKRCDEWLNGKPYLPMKALGQGQILKAHVSTVQESRFEAPRTQDRFSAPMFLIGENASLPCAFIQSGIYAFRNSIISINAPKADEKALRDFSVQFLENRDDLISLGLLKSSRSLISKSTSLLKRDIDLLPWPSKKFMGKLSWWERSLIDDVSNAYAPMIRVGQNSPAYTKTVNDSDFKIYAAAFVRLLGSVYNNLTSGSFAVFNGIACQSFHFGKPFELNWHKEWEFRLKKILYDDTSASFRTLRVVRYYQGNMMVIIKPDRWRNWIPSTAVRDSDETLMDLRLQGF